VSLQQITEKEQQNAVLLQQLETDRSKSGNGWIWFWIFLFVVAVAISFYSKYYSKQESSSL
jgi:hypothetical protein